MSHARIRALRRLAGLAVLLPVLASATTPDATPAAGAASPASPDAPSPSELEGLGWTPVAEPAPSCVLEQPKLQAREAVWMSVHRPDALPQPGWSCGPYRVVLPLSKDPALLERIETPTPTIAWAVRAQGRARGASAVVDLDFAPYRSEPAPAAAGPGAVGEMTSEFGQPLFIPPRPIRDPASRGRASKYNRVPEPPLELVQPELQVVRVPETGIREDGLHATADGTTWVSLSLPRERAAARFSLRPDRVFGGEGRLFVAPRALQVDAATALLAVDPHSGATLSLGKPAPADAGHWLRITDVRERAGVVEVLTCVDDVARTGITSPWGIHARRDGARWIFLQRFFTPHAKNVLPELRFDPVDPGKVWLHSGEARAWQPLAPQEPPAAP